MFTNIINSRKIFFLITVFCITVLAYTYYAQYWQYQEPCPLCIAQRIIIALIGFFALIFTFINPNKFWLRIAALIIAGFGIFGIKTAYHHLWLINLPPQDLPQACGMPLEVLYKQLPLNSFIHKIFEGSAECATVKWTLFGISGPMLSLIAFSLITLLACYLLIIKSRKTSYEIL